MVSTFLRHLILAIFANAIAMWATTQLIPGAFTVTGGFIAFAVAGVVFGLLNTIVKPIIKLFSLPLIFLSMGLLLIVINAVILGLSQYVLNTLHFTGIGGEVISIAFPGGWTSYLIAAVVLSIVNSVSHWLFEGKR